MKKIIIALVVLGWTAALSAAEAVPEYVMLTILNGRARGENVESARTPVVCTSLHGDVLDVDIQTEFQGGGNLDFAIPPEAKKIKLFGCVYDLPPAGHTAFFHSFLLADIRKPWWRFSRDEIQRAMMLISYAPDRKSFEAQIWLCGRSGRDEWKNGRTFSCIIADDGQIFEKLDIETLARFSPGIRYWKSRVFRNGNGKMQVFLNVTGRSTEFVLADVPLPPPDERPCTLFFLNYPFREKYLADNQTDEFALKRSVAEFRQLAEKLKSLRQDMTPDETSKILGKPDRYHTVGVKGTRGGELAFAKYDFLRFGDTSMKNLTVTLRYEKDSAGTFRLKDVY